MLKIVMSGIWICLVTAVSVYVASSWSAGAGPGESDEPYIKGLDYRKTPMLTVPVIKNGKVTGYVVGRFVFTAAAETLRELSVPPEVFVSDEAFRALYADDEIDFEHLERYDLGGLTRSITLAVNERMRMDLVQDTLVDQLNYFPMGEMNKQFNRPPTGAPKEESKGGGH